MLAYHFLDLCTKETKKQIDGISKEAMNVLLEYDWPGNVRELENVIEHAAIIAKQNKILPKDLPQYLLQKTLTTQEVASLEDFEKSLILKTLKETNWNKHQTAKRLKINRSTLYAKIKRYGLMRARNQELTV